MNITDAQFGDFPNRSGIKTYSYAELLAQLQIDIGGGGASEQIGKGCKATATTISIVAGGRNTVPFDTAVFDDAGFLDIGGANPERMTIPLLNPTIKRIVVGGYQNWSAGATGTIRSLVFIHNTNEVTFGSTMQIPLTVVPGDANRTLAMSPPIDVVAGDWFETQAVISNGAGAPVNLTQAAGWIIVVR